MLLLPQSGAVVKVIASTGSYSGRYSVRLVLEQRSQPTAAFAAVGVFGDDRPFRGLYKDPAIPFESHLERLSAAASREGLEGDVAPDTRPHTAAPGDGGLGVGEGWGRRVEEDGLPVRGEGDPARAFEDDVEEAAREAAGALDPLYVPVDTGLEGEDVVAVDGHTVAVEVQDHDLALVLCQEQVARPVGRHQLYALARDRLLEETAQAPALVLEANVTLIGDHRAELGLDLVVLQSHFEHRRVLQREPPLRRNLPKLLQVRLSHRITSLTGHSPT